VARWPAAGPREEAAERQVAAALELIRAIRNARAEAGIEPGAWLPIDVQPVRDDASLAGLEAAVARLARARPLTTGETAAAANTIAVVTPDFEAAISRPEQATAAPTAGDRARLEKELAEAEARLAAARARLADSRFLERAPAHVVDGARASEAELAGHVERLRGSLG